MVGSAAGFGADDQPDGGDGWLGTVGEAGAGVKAAAVAGEGGVASLVSLPLPTVGAGGVERCGGGGGAMTAAAGPGVAVGAGADVVGAEAKEPSWGRGLMEAAGTTLSTRLMMSSALRSLARAS